MKKIFTIISAAFALVALNSCLDLKGEIDKTIAIAKNIPIPLSFEVAYEFEQDIPITEETKHTTYSYDMKEAQDILDILSKYQLDQMKLKGTLSSTSNVSFDVILKVCGIGGIEGADAEVRVSLPANAKNVPVDLDIKGDSFNKFNSLDLDITAVPEAGHDAVKKGDKITFNSEYFTSENGIQISL